MCFECCLLFKFWYFKIIDIYDLVKNVIIKEKNMNIFSLNCDNVFLIIVKNLLIWVIEYFIEVFCYFIFVIIKRR